MSLPPSLATMGGWGLFFHRGRARLSRLASRMMRQSSNSVLRDPKTRPAGDGGVFIQRCCRSKFGLLLASGEEGKQGVKLCYISHRAC
jgi:hypothetical protein